MAAAQRPSLAPRAGAVCVRQVRAIWHDRRSTVQRASGPSLAVARGCARAVVTPLTPRTGIVRVSAALRLPDAPLPDCPHCPARPPRGSDVCSCRSRTAHGAAQSPPLEPRFTWRPLLRLPSVQALRSLGLTRAHSVWRLRPLWPPPPSRGRFAAVTTSGGAAAGPRTAGIDGARLRGPGAPPESPPPWMCPPQPMTAW